jgi:hypothetical protein
MSHPPECDNLHLSRQNDLHEAETTLVVLVKVFLSFNRREPPLWYLCQRVSVVVGPN